MVSELFVKICLTRENVWILLLNTKAALGRDFDDVSSLHTKVSAYQST